MTLGEFRKITEHYPDDTPICISNTGYSGISGAYLVDRILIDFGSATDDDPELVPNVVLI